VGHIAVCEFGFNESIASQTLAQWHAGAPNQLPCWIESPKGLGTEAIQSRLIRIVDWNDSAAIQELALSLRSLYV
jgi:hypothetical protein